MATDTEFVLQWSWPGVPNQGTVLNVEVTVLADSEAQALEIMRATGVIVPVNGAKRVGIYRKWIVYHSAGEPPK